MRDVPAAHTKQWSLKINRREIRNDPTEFATVTVDPELGVLCWSNGADIDAELLRYDDLWNETLPVAHPA